MGFLFLTGFLTSAVFGSFIGELRLQPVEVRFMLLLLMLCLLLCGRAFAGGYVDRWGRRCGCIVFCLLEVRPRHWLW